ncbi:MAG: Gfo/Idh/MocA family oxidoreductase [Litorilinea sp.]
MSVQPSIRFAAIGLNHDHINGMTQLLIDAGGELVWVYAEEPELLADYRKRFPQAQPAVSWAQVLEDESIHLVISAAIPSDRAAVGVAALRHGKDFMSDKPGFTTAAQLEDARRVQAETGRIWSINYSERFENRATEKAGELVRNGAIGTVIQTVGLGPHRRRFPTRAPWFFQRERFGGILNDIASHQIDQFIHFTQAETVEVVASQVANFHHPQYPEFEDFGDVMLRGPACTGYIRVDWFTPDGMSAWGDTRLVVIGTEGTIEVRKNVDVAGRAGGNHLFLIDNQSEQYIDCAQVELPYGPRLIHDIVNRTETAMDQDHCFWVTELALQAQAQAARLGHLADTE